jgi:catecholate siderophore receptor
VLDHDNVKADMATVKVEHDFAGGAKLVNTSRYGKTKQDYLLTSFMATNANLANIANPDRTLDHGAPT